MDRHTVELAAEFAASLDGDRPVEVRTTLAAVERNRRAWFGEFADPRIGGANALLALSGVTSTSTSIVLRNPAALSLSLATSADALSEHVRVGRIRVQQCFGFSRGRGVSPHVSDEITSTMTGSGSYAVYLELAAVVDPK